MKGLKIIPMFLALIVLSYVGMLFVESNRDSVIIQFADYRTPPTALGFVVLTSMLMGMMISGVLCMVELLALIVQNKRLKRKLNNAKTLPTVPRPGAVVDALTPTPTILETPNDLEGGRKFRF